MRKHLKLIASGKNDTNCLFHEFEFIARVGQAAAPRGMAWPQQPTAANDLKCQLDATR